MKILNGIIQVLLIGLVARFTLVFAYEAILGDVIIKTVMYYMISGLLACLLVSQVVESEVYKFILKKKSDFGRKNEIN